MRVIEKCSLKNIKNEPLMTHKRLIVAKMERARLRHCDFALARCHLKTNKKITRKFHRNVGRQYLKNTQVLLNTQLIIVS